MRDITPAQIKAETTTAKAVAEQGIETDFLYPLTIEGCGPASEATKYRWRNLRTDDCGVAFSTYSEAYLDAVKQKEKLQA